MQDSIRKILEAAIRAPSGHNLQPWKLVVQNGQIDIYNTPEKSHPLYNYGQKSFYVAHGTMIENIMIAARQNGFVPEAVIFPDTQSPNYVAKILLKKSDIEPQPLYEYISKRATNRKPYYKTPLMQEQKHTLLAYSDFIPGVKVKLVEDREAIKTLAKASSIHEKLVLENQSLHKYMFEAVRWTSEEAQTKGDGMLITTLEMPKPGELIFKLCSNWGRATFLRKFGLSDIISSKNSKVYEQSAAFVAVIAPDNSDKNFVSAGRVAERLWLEATKMKLALHPLTGIIHFMQTLILSDNASGFSAEEADLIKSSYEAIKNIFKVDTETIGFIFRIGEADGPTAHSDRIAMEKVVQED